MPIIYVGWIDREDVQKHPEYHFVFGDNRERRGMGGQAKAMRGEPNSIGVPTKHSPTNDADAYFSEENEGTAAIIRHMLPDLIRIEELLEKGKTVCIPQDGIGSGLSEMDHHCPFAFKILNDIIFDAWSGKYGSKPVARLDD